MKIYQRNGQDIKNRPQPSRMKASGYHHAVHGPKPSKDKK
jgi:hypothetical protein